MHLSDCFIDIFAYVTFFLKSVDARQPSCDQVKADIRRLLAESEGFTVRGNFSRDDYEQSRFAVCAWVDEVLLNAPWQESSFWLKDQLQRHYYNTTDAGEEFFDRLSAIGLHQREVREVYYLCLALGFTGRYCHTGDEYQLEQIKTSNLKLLLGSSVGLPSLERSDLFPEALPSIPVEKERQRARFGSRLVFTICLLGPVFLFCLLYGIYRFTLSGIGENFLRTVSN
jgi:type VI secretion system protein ImpK